MNERHDPSPPHKLQALNLAALGDALDQLVCDIDDPDCEAPGSALSPLLDGDARRTEVAPEGVSTDLDERGR